jgi:hypothetical protein
VTAKAMEYKGNIKHKLIWQMQPHLLLPLSQISGFASFVEVLLYRYKNENSYQRRNHEGIIPKWWTTELFDQQRACICVGKIMGQGATGSKRHEGLV